MFDLLHPSVMRRSEVTQTALTSAVPPLVTMATRRRNPTLTVPTKLMTLFMITVPIMVLAVALAVLPLILLSHTDHRHRLE